MIASDYKAEKSLYTLIEIQLVWLNVTKAMSFDIPFPRFYSGSTMLYFVLVTRPLRISDRRSESEGLELWLFVVHESDAEPVYFFLEHFSDAFQVSDLDLQTPMSFGVDLAHHMSLEQSTKLVWIPVLLIPLLVNIMQISPGSG